MGTYRSEAGADSMKVDSYQSVDALEEVEQEGK
jgi:hypothetical protein